MCSKKLSITIMFTSVLLTACGGTVDGARDAVPSPSSSSTSATADQNAIDVDNYKFRVAPLIESDGQAHIDVFITDKGGNHLPDLKGTFGVTAPDGHTDSVSLIEDKTGKHYTATLKLDHMGEYQAVVQTQIAGTPYNPRFTISRK
jgi:hypothetical protein